MRFVADCLDGRLSSLDRLAVQVPEAKAVVKRRAGEHGLLPESIVSVLASYPFRPAEWLVDRELTTLGQDQLDVLLRALVGVLKDGHREAVIKCLPIWSAAQAGTLRTSAETIALLESYPNDLATLARADSVVRAMWGANRGLLLRENRGHFESAVRWARVFWGANSMTSRCARRRGFEGNEREATEAALGGPTNAEPSLGEDSSRRIPERGAHLRRLAMDLLSSYVEALETAPSSLYDREPREVHSGLVARIARDVITALGAPDLWCMEHGAHIARGLVEARIYLQWMGGQDQSIYRAFQEYGAGKAKLYKRIMDEIPEQARSLELVRAVEELKRLSHNDEVLDYRTVDTSDSFAAGKSIRQMADECGLLDLYRQAYSLASGIAHSEWWAVETNAMEPCMNPLHGGHLIPSFSLSAGGNVELASAWVDQLNALIRMSLLILGTDVAAVRTAFARMEVPVEDT